MDEVDSSKIGIDRNQQGMVLAPVSYSQYQVCFGRLGDVLDHATAKNLRQFVDHGSENKAVEWYFHNLYGGYFSNFGELFPED